MSITNKLNQIKNAIYGKEVRGAIHDAIKECYDDASVNHDNANMEVKMARGTHNTLNARLDNVDEIQAQTNAQLSQDKKELGGRIDVIIANNNDTDGNSELVDIRIATDGDFYKTAGSAVRGQIEKINKALDSALVRKESKNLLNPNLIENGYVSEATGDIVESSNTFASWFISVEKGDVIYVYNTLGATSSVSMLCCYDNVGKYLNIFQKGSISTYTVPEGVGFIRVSSQYLKSIGIFKNTGDNKYEPYFDKTYSVMTDEVENIFKKVNNNQQKLNEIDGLIDKNKMGMSIFYNKRPKVYQPFNYPSEYGGTYKPVQIFYDGKNFITNFNKNNFMHISKNIYYIAPRERGGHQNNDGLSKEKPTLLNVALEKCIDGDTIIALEGEYYKNTLNEVSEYVISKNINLIGDGDVRFIWNGYNQSFSLQDNGLYKASLSGTLRVIDKSLDYELIKTNSVEECINTPMSYYATTNEVYVNTDSEPNVYLLIGGNGLVLRDIDKKCKIYIENITNIGGTTGITQFVGNYGIETIFNKCKFLYNVGTTDGQNTTLIRGGYVLFNECINMFSRFDGFCYQDFTHTVNRVQFVELNCIGANNGLGVSADNCNGSTSHHSTRGIRINSLYYNNGGGNVTDVQENNQTLNLGCESYESGAIERKQGFSIQQDGSKMWLYNCVAKDNEQFDLVCSGVGSIMYLHECDYHTKSGNGVYKEI